MFLVSFLAFGITSIGTYIVATVFGAAVYIFTQRRQFFALMVKVAYHQIIKQPVQAVGTYLKDYKNEFALAQLWSVVGANVILIDRFLVSKAHPNSFATYVLIANIANIIATFHNLGYVTFQRPVLLRPDTRAMGQIFALQNWVIPVGLSGAVLAGYSVLGMAEFEITDLPLSITGLLFVLYIFHAASLVPKEIAFWRFRRIILLGCDLLTIAIPVFSFYVISQSIIGIILAALCGLIVRFVLFTLLIAKPHVRTHL